MGTAGPIWLILFFNVRNSPNEIFMKKKMEKLPGKLENSRETDGAFFYGIFVMDMRNFCFVLFVMVLEKFSGKKNLDNYKGKLENSDKRCREEVSSYSTLQVIALFIQI
jgi:hypothetical protein